MRPSFDRLNDGDGYSFSNFNKWMTWEDNRLKAFLDMASGKLISGGNPHKAVIQFKNGVKFQEFVSVREAARIMKLSVSRISEVCNGKSKIAGGFQWKFKEA